METARNPSNGDPPPGLAISPAVARQIGHALGFSTAEILADAQRVATWSGPADDLLVWFERRYHWKARSAFIYLLSLKSGLRNSKPEHR